MKNILTFLLGTLIWIAPTALFAQVNLQVVLPDASVSSGGMPIDRLENTATVRNIGNQPSAPFDILFIISVDDDFSDINETQITISSPSLAECNNPSVPSSCDSTEVTLPYELPYPRQSGGLFDDPSLRLFEDNLQPSEWMGESLYFKVCIIESGVIPALSTCPESSVVVIPPRAPGTGGAVNSAGDGFEITWRFQPDENGVSLADSFRLSKSGGVVGGSLELDLADVSVIGVGGANPRYQYVDTNVTPGVGYGYLVQNCTTGSGVKVCPDGASGFGGIVIPATFDATAGTRTDGVEVQWVEYQVGTPGYEIRRCDADNPSSCVVLDPRVTALSYLDTSALPGRSYIYEVFACRSYSTTAPNLCQNSLGNSNLRQTGSSNIAFVGLLPDQFENDSNASQAAPIVANASNGLARTFDQQGDVDWLRFTLTDASDISVDASNGLGSAIGIELFDASLAPIGAQSTSALQASALASGDYFIRLTDLTPSMGPYIPIAYEVELTASAIVLPDQYENDNVLSDAKPIANAETQKRTFHQDGDIDWVRFTLANTSNVRIDTFDNANADIRVELFDSSFQPIGGDTDSKLPTLLKIEVASLKAGDYFFRVTDRTISAGPYQPIPYSVELSVVPVTLTGIQPDQFEDDNASNKAQPIDRSVLQTRSFHTADDNDWIRLILQKPQSVSIATMGTNLSDTQIFLYDSGLRRLGYSANTPGVNTTHARLVTGTLAAGEYFVLINQIDASVEGFDYVPIESYTLKVTLESEPESGIDLTPILMLLLDD